MAKILATALYPLWTKHFVAEMSFVEEHFAKGDEVSVLMCDARLRACSCNPVGGLSGCLLCMGARDIGFDLLSQRPHFLPLISDHVLSLDVPERLAFFSGNLEELKALEVDNFDIGFAAFSPLVDVAKTYLPDPRTHRELIRRLLVDAWRTYTSAIELLKSVRFDRVYIFNGRFAAARAWLRACQRMNTPFVTHDRTRSPTRVHLYENTIPHDLRPRATWIENFWEANKDDKEVVAKGHQFFRERVPDAPGGGVGFVSSQQHGMLPDGFDPDRENIAFFPTTEGELAGIQDLSRKGLFDSQVEAYAWIAGQLSERAPRVRVYMRVHPNSSREKSRWWELPAYQELGNLTVIPPESPVSTYSLMKAASKVVVFRSTIGIEAAYWGNVSLILCPAGYSRIGAVYEPETPDQAVELLLADLEPRPQLNAVKFGCFMMCAGTPLPHAGLEGGAKMTFKGKIIEAPKEIREIAHNWWVKREQLPPWLFALLSPAISAQSKSRYRKVRRSRERNRGQTVRQ